jgi:deoxyribonuclease V
MILAVDAQYDDSTSTASVAGVLFEDWSSSTEINVYTAKVSNVAPYEPGSFYKRELPCILNLLEKIDLSKVATIIVDGYVDFSEFHHGLGRKLYDCLSQKINIVGVAKTPFISTKHNFVYRGKNAKNPLYVTCTNKDVDVICENVKNMYGQFRLPYMLKLVDSVARKSL